MTGLHFLHENGVWTDTRKLMVLFEIQVHRTPTWFNIIYFGNMLEFENCSLRPGFLGHVNQRSYVHNFQRCGVPY